MGKEEDALLDKLTGATAEAAAQPMGHAHPPAGGAAHDIPQDSWPTGMAASVLEPPEAAKNLKACISRKEFAKYAAQMAAYAAKWAADSLDDCPDDIMPQEAIERFSARMRQWLYAMEPKARP